MAGTEEIGDSELLLEIVQELRKLIMAHLEKAINNSPSEAQKDMASIEELLSSEVWDFEQIRQRIEELFPSGAGVGDLESYLKVFQQLRQLTMVYSRSYILESLESSVADQKNDGEKLFWAFLRDDWVTAETLLGSNDTDIDMLSENGLGLLHYAVLRESLDWIDLLSKFGASPNLAGPTHGITPLFISLFQSNTEVVERLLALGADPNRPGNPTGSGLLFFASRLEKIEMGVALAKAGGNLSVLDESHADFKNTILERLDP